MVAFVLGGCAVATLDGSLSIEGNGGIVCMPVLGATHVQLGGLVVGPVDERASVVSAGLSDSAGLSQSGAYMVPLEGSFDLAGFAYVDADWSSHVPVDAIRIDGTEQPLKQGEAYNLVFVVKTTNSVAEAHVRGFWLEYLEGEQLRRALVDDSVVLPRGVQTC